jgi:hypothetical protein
MWHDIVAALTGVPMRIITFATHTTHILQMFDVMLFSALKKHATGLETLDEEQSAVAFLLKVYHDLKKLWLKSTYRETLQSLALLMTSSKFRMDYSSTWKSSDKVAASSNSRNAIHPWRVCRNDGESQSLDRLTNQNKPI